MRIDWHTKCLKILREAVAERRWRLLALPPYAFSQQPSHDRRQREISMTKYRLEYIWLDGYKPTPNLRGKTQLKDFDVFPALEQLPLWGFDGSSTQQAEGHNSDCILKPVAV